MNEYMLALRENYNFSENLPVKMAKLGEVAPVSDVLSRVNWKLRSIVKLITG